MLCDLKRVFRVLKKICDRFISSPYNDVLKDELTQATKLCDSQFKLPKQM